MQHAALCILLAFLWGATAAAQTASPSPTPAPTAAPVQTAATNAWQFDLTPYLWLPSFNGQLAFASPRFPALKVAGVPVIHVHAGPSTYLQNLNSAAMLAFYARRGGTSFGTDFIYLNLTTSKASVTSVSRPDGTVEIPINTSTSARFRGSIWTLDVGQALNKTDFSPIEVLGGFRYLGTSASADWNFQGPLDVLPRSGSVSKQLHLWDPIVGFRGKLGLGAHWYVPYYADYGGGTGNNTFQALAGIANSQRWGDIVLANRWLEYYFNDQRGNQDVQLVGPTLAVRIRL